MNTDSVLKGIGLLVLLIATNSVSVTGATLGESLTVSGYVNGITNLTYPGHNFTVYQGSDGTIYARSSILGTPLFSGTDVSVINSALNAATGEVKVMCGRYPVPNNNTQILISGKNGITLSGEGECTEYYLTGSNLHANVIEVINSQSIVLKDFYANATSSHSIAWSTGVNEDETNQSAINFKNTKNSTISGVWANNARRHGIILQNDSTGNLIEASRADNNFLHGIQLRSNDNLVSNNILVGDGGRGHAGVGILLHNASNNTVMGNTVRKYPDVGIYIAAFGTYLTKNNVIVHNTVKENGWGIFSTGGGNTICDNYVYDNERSGIRIRSDKAANNTICDNKVWNNVLNTDDSDQTNGVNGLQLAGIAIGGNGGAIDGNTVTGNVVRAGDGDKQESGIFADENSVTNLTISNNYLRNSGRMKGLNGTVGVTQLNTSFGAGNQYKNGTWGAFFES